MKSPLKLIFYLLRANPVRAEISLRFGTDLKVPTTVETHSRSPRGLDKKKFKIRKNWNLNVLGASKCLQ